MAGEVPSTPQTTLVVLLGASAWPRWPDLDSEAFANSAQEVRNYFLDPSKFHLPRENLLDLFDSDQSADDIDEAIGQFLTTRITEMEASNQATRDVLVYFIGHAGFAEESLDYYLAIRRTRKNNPETSGLRIVSLAKTVKENTRKLRRILILDCCYAASALAAFHAQGVGLEEAATIQTLDAFRGPRLRMNAQHPDWPTKGTALLCSSSRGKPSRLGEHYTEFSQALLHVLNTGTADELEYMSLDMAADLVREFLDETGSGAPRPEVHNPDQREGYVADVPFFPNPQAEEERVRQAEKEKQRLAEEAERASRVEEERQRQAEEERARQAQEREKRRLAEEAEQTRRMEEVRQRSVEKELARQIEEATQLRKTVKPTHKIEEQASPVWTPPSLASLPPTEMTPPSQSSAAQPTEITPAGSPSPVISRRAVVIGLAGISVAALAGGGIAVLSHTPPSTRSQSPQYPSSTPAPNPAISSSGAMFGFDPQHTRFNPNEHVLSPTNVSRLVPYWTASTGGHITSSPAVANGVVYIGSDDSKLYAFDAVSGKPLWTASVPGLGITSSPAVASDMVYIAASGMLYTFDATNGNPRWNANIGNTPFVNDCSPTVAGGVIYILGGELHAFNATSGKSLWTNSIYDTGSSPAVANGVVYAVWTTNLDAISATSGEYLWGGISIGDFGSHCIYSSPAVANGIIYVGSEDHNLYAVRATNGKVLWTTPTSDQVQSSPAIANGIVYVGSDDHNLYAVRATDGKILWTASTDGSIYSSPMVANGVVYVGSADHRLHAFNASNGKILWTASTGDQVQSSPVVANGVVYVGSWDHKLYAFHLP